MACAQEIIDIACSRPGELKFSWGGVKELRIKPVIESATNVAVFLTCAVLLTALALNFFHKAPATRLQSGLRKGDTLEQQPGIDYRRTPQTLLIGMSSTCGFCQESLPFYKELAETLSQHADTTRLLAVMPERDDAAKHFLQQNGLPHGSRFA